MKTQSSRTSMRKQLICYRKQRVLPIVGIVFLSLLFIITFFFNSLERSHSLVTPQCVNIDIPAIGSGDGFSDHLREQTEFQPFKFSCITPSFPRSRNFAPTTIGICIHEPAKDTQVSGSFARGGWWSADIANDVMEWITSHPGDFIDVGANIGSITLPLAFYQRSTNSTVYAFEANPKNFFLLRTGIALNGNQLGNIESFNCAVNKNQTTGFAFGRAFGAEWWDNPVFGDSNMGGAQTSVSNPSIHMDNGFKIPRCTLDGTLEGRTSRAPISIIKLDCEGCEAHALMSAERILTTDRPAIRMEVTETYLLDSGISFRELLLFMRRKGYALYDQNKRSLSHRYDLDDPLQKDFLKRDDPITYAQMEVWFLHSSHFKA